MIYIIRHGETEMNSRKLLQGRSDCPLNEKGLAQAAAAARQLSGIHFDAVYSSPLLRARQTAGTIAADTAAVVDERLIEMDYGPYEGLSLVDLPEEVLTFFSDFVHNRAPRGMEALEDVVARTGAFMEAQCRREGDILISTHAIAMKGILEYLTPDAKGSYWSKYIGNCEVYVTAFRDGHFLVPQPMDSRAQ